MTTNNVGTIKLLTPAHKCTDHAVTLQDSIGLTISDDPLMGEKVVNFEFSKLTKKKNCFQLINIIFENENITTPGKVF